MPAPFSKKEGADDPLDRNDWSSGSSVSSPVIVWLSPVNQEKTFLSVVHKWKLDKPEQGKVVHEVHGLCFWRKANL